MVGGVDVLLYGGAGCTSALGNFRFSVDIIDFQFQACIARM